MVEPPDNATTSELPGAAVEPLMGLWRQFGGAGAGVLRAGKWDFAAEGLLIELDEQEHFNRYRSMALDLPGADRMPWAADYGPYCRDMEGKCRTHGGYWSTPSADRMMGGSDAPGVHGVLGPSRWKQRALYDALRDVWAVATGHTLARLSIYDTVAGTSLDAVLKGRQTLDPDALRGLIEDRTSPV